MNKLNIHVIQLTSWLDIYKYIEGKGFPPVLAGTGGPVLDLSRLFHFE